VEEVLYKIVWQGWGPRNARMVHNEDHTDCHYVSYFETWESVQRSLKANKWDRKSKVYTCHPDWIKVDDD
jgi:hypothetical protein